MREFDFERVYEQTIFEVCEDVYKITLPHNVLLNELDSSQGE